MNKFLIFKFSRIIAVEFTQYLKFGLLIAAILALMGCPMWVANTVYNNTESDLAVQLKDEQIIWTSGTALRLDKDIERKMEWIDEDGHYIPVFTTRDNTTESTYKLVSLKHPIPVEYIGRSPGKGFKSGTEEYRFQLENDGNLYIVKPDQQFPVNIKSQPPGFPIVPTIVKLQ